MYGRLIQSCIHYTSCDQSHNYSIYIEDVLNVCNQIDWKQSLRLKMYREQFVGNAILLLMGYKAGHHAVLKSFTIGQQVLNGCQPKQ